MKRFSDDSARAVKAQQVTLLLMRAATNKQVLNYDDVSKYIGYKGAGVIGPILEYIYLWCVKNKLPLLVVLVNNKATGIPGAGLTNLVKNPAKEVTKVHQYDWNDVIPPTADELNEAYRG